jgi:hypothetical protein
VTPDQAVRPSTCRIVEGAIVTYVPAAHVCAEPRPLSGLLSRATFGADVIDGAAAFRLLAITVLYQYDHDLARRFYRWLANHEHTDELHLAPGDARGQLADALVMAERDRDPVEAFVTLLLDRRFTVGQWRAAYAAVAISPAALTGGNHQGMTES